VRAKIAEALPTSLAAGLHRPSRGLPSSVVSTVAAQSRAL